jgi:LacI family transcriptional regulator
LNDTKPTTLEVAQRVWLAAKMLGYRPNQAARVLKTGSTRAIGFVVPDLQNPFFPRSHRARELGYSLMLVDINDDPRVEGDVLEQFARAGVGAVICGSLKVKLPTGLPYPVIALDSPMPGSDGVHADHFHSGMLAMQYALEHGHERIGMLSGPQTTASAKPRRDGAVSAVGHAQIIWEYDTNARSAWKSQKKQFSNSCNATSA